MNKNVRTVLLLGLFAAVTLTTQATTTTLLNETLLTQESFNTFSAYSVAGTQTWYSASYGAVCSGYSGGINYENEDWLISPALNLLDATSATLSFDHTRGNASVINVGLTEGWYKVYATARYTGNPTTTQWVEIENVNHAVSRAWTFISSGQLTIPAAAQSAETCIAFKYVCDSTQSASWEIKNVMVTAESTSTEPANTDTVFKVVTWNVEHFGSTCYGPSDEALQLSNVAAAILSMNADVVCLQEVTQSTTTPTINNLVALLGDEWDGTIKATNEEECSQNQGFIYKKSKVQYVSSALLSSGVASQGNSYSYNWSSGRYPVLYKVNLKVGTDLIPVSFINIHAKAFSDSESYTRRLGGAIALKQELDGSAYNDENLILIGDFNDYLSGSSCSTCGDSPFQNFMLDTENYMGLTQNLVDNGCSEYPHTIDNMIISNELFDTYVANSVKQETGMTTLINNYCSTTSDHLPVSASFYFSATVNTNLNETFANENTTLDIFPNPVQQQLNIATAQLAGNVAEIYDVKGQLVLRTEILGKTINVTSLISGIYVLKLGNERVRFVKL